VRTISVGELRSHKYTIADVDFITDNPFYEKYPDNSVCATWIAENSSQVKKSITKEFNKMGHYDANYAVEDCMDKVIEYFIVNKDVEFDEDYFLKKLFHELKDSDLTEKEMDDKYEYYSNYSMEAYILHRVRLAAKGYVSKLNKERDEIRFIDNYDDENVNSNEMTEDRISTITVDVKYLDPADIVDVLSIEDMLSELDSYDAEFQMKGLKNFSLKKFVQASLLGRFDNEYEKAKFMGVDINTFRNYTSAMQLFLKGNRYQELKQLLMDIIDSNSKMAYFRKEEYCE